MSNMKPCRKAVEAVDKIIDLLEKEKISFEEVADIPAELQRRINKNTSRLKKDNIFTDHR